MGIVVGSIVVGSIVVGSIVVGSIVVGFIVVVCPLPAHVNATLTSLSTPSTTVFHPLVWWIHFLAPVNMNLFSTSTPTCQQTNIKDIANYLLINIIMLKFT